MIQLILGFFAKIVQGIITDALQSPAKEISVEEVSGILEATPDTDDILDRFAGVLDWN